MSWCGWCPGSSSSSPSPTDTRENRRPLLSSSSSSSPLRPLSCIGHPSDDQTDAASPCPHSFDQVFILQDQIGKGSTATCFRCLHRKSGAVLAVKIIDKRRVQLNYSSALLEQFRMEARILRSVQHPNIIRLFECFEDQQSLHVVTELVSEGELFDYLVERPDRLLSEAEASGIVRQIASAVSYLHHKERVVHRDIKLENILVSRRPVEEEGEVFPQVKLIDFGLAKRLGGGGSSTLHNLDNNNQAEIDEDPNATQSTAQTYFGTMGYIAPEMNLRRAYNQQVDVWAMGVLTYVLLCGVFPFEGNNQYQMPIRYPPWAQSISASAKDLVGKLLCVDPVQRLSASKMCAHEWVAGATASRLAVLGTPQMLDQMRLSNQYGGGQQQQRRGTSQQLGRRTTTTTRQEEEEEDTVVGVSSNDLEGAVSPLALDDRRRG